MKKLTIFTMQLKTPGGIERFVSTLATMLSKDFKVEIIANYGKKEDPLAFPLPENVKVTYLTAKQPAEVSMKNLITGFKWNKIPRELKRRQKIEETKNEVYKKFLKNLKTDFIITDRAAYSSLVSKYYPGEALKIATDHNHHQNNKKYIDELLSSIKTFDYLVVATKELRDFYADKTGFTKCAYIPNPLPSIPTKKSELKTKNILAAGRLEPEKDFSSLLDAMRILKTYDLRIKLTLIGDGSEKEKLKQQIKKENLGNVTLTGWLPQEDMKKYYYDSSLFVLTSKTEAFGLVLTEAMSYGLPCVAFDRASGARNLITSETGALVKGGDPVALALTIKTMLDDKQNLQQLQNNINEYILTFSTPAVRPLWLKILR